MSQRKVLFYFIEDVDSFVENECVSLTKHFDKIVMISVAKRRLDAISSYNNISFEAIELGPEYSIKSEFKRNGGQLINFFFTELYNCKKKVYYLRNSKQWLSILAKGFYKAQKVAELVLKEERILNTKLYFHSFWTSEWALVLSVLKAKQVIAKFTTRCGGYDIYDERHPGNYMPMRYVMYKYANCVYANTQIGRQYILDLNIYPEKIGLNYFGTQDYGTCPVPTSNPHIIFSCGNIIELKRVHLIIEILKHVKSDVRWVHIGGGDLEDEVRASAASQHGFKYDMRGFKENYKDLLDFYLENAVSCFIMCSRTEGLPVSIQEAQSFGVPVMATNVGGISEIVNESNGVLIEKDFQPKEAAVLLDNLLNTKARDPKFRAGIRKFWENSFELNDRMAEFIAELEKNAG